jgi:hypothetical protein
MKKIGGVVKNYFVNYFIPHKGNDNRPHILRPRAIAFVCMVALVAESAFVFGAKYIIPQSKLFGIIEVNALVDETNQNRVTNGLPDLQVSSLLTAAAQDKANDEASKGYFAHTSPQGLTPWYWFQQAGYNFDYAGENLAVNFSDSEDVTTAWMSSPEHRANILSTDFTQIGIATAQGVYEGEPTTFVVEEFGTPAPAAAPTLFVDTASAATAPVVATAPAVAAPTVTPGVQPPTKIVITKPATIPKTASASVATVPVVVSIQSSSAPAMQQMFIAVQGEATQTVPAAPTTIPATTSAPSVGMTAATTPSPAQSNIVQQLLSDPKAMANDFYFFVMALFLIALVLNIFINIRVQYPKLIAGGLLVIVTAGLCIMLNQNIGFLHTVIL